MKLTLAEFKEFADSLSDNWCFEGDEEFIDETLWDGTKYINPGEVVDIPNDGVTICWQGEWGKAPNGEEYLDFITEFKKWKKKQTHDTIGVSIPKEKRKEFEEYVKSIGGKVI